MECMYCKSKIAQKPRISWVKYPPQVKPGDVFTLEFGIVDGTAEENVITCFGERRSEIIVFTSENILDIDGNTTDSFTLSLSETKPLDTLFLVRLSLIGSSEICSDYIDINITTKEFTSEYIIEYLDKTVINNELLYIGLGLLGAYLVFK